MRQILEDNDARAPALVEARGIVPAERLAIYAHNAAENFLNSLRSSFPAIVRLGGEEYFRGCARLYQQRFPSRSGDLQHVGDHFAAFLGELHAAEAHRYFEDVARLEWLYQYALIAADHPLLDLSELAAVSPDRHDELRFSLHPAVGLYESAFPAVSIWEANTSPNDKSGNGTSGNGTSGNDTSRNGTARNGTARNDTFRNDLPIISLDVGSERLAFTRLHGRVEWLRLTAGEYRFLAELEQGAAFGEAVRASVAVDPEFDAVAALQRFVLSAVIVDFLLDSRVGVTAQKTAPNRQIRAAAAAVARKD